MLVLCQITGRLPDNSLVFPFWRLTRLTNKPALSFSLVRRVGYSHLHLQISMSRRALRTATRILRRESQHGGRSTGDICLDFSVTHKVGTFENHRRRSLVSRVYVVYCTYLLTGQRWEGQKCPTKRRPVIVDISRRSRYMAIKYRDGR